MGSGHGAAVRAIAGNVWGEWGERSGVGMEERGNRGRWAGWGGGVGEIRGGRREKGLGWRKGGFGVGERREAGWGRRELRE